MNTNHPDSGSKQGTPLRREEKIFHPRFAAFHTWMTNRSSVRQWQEPLRRELVGQTQGIVLEVGAGKVRTSPDASALLMIPTHFVGPTDPCILHTIDRVQRELTSDSLVRRYNPRTAADDGLGSPEGTFTPCSFWLAEALARAGRVEEARLMLEKMLTYANHVGLYAEEIGPSGEALGNFPQAFTHLSLITACSHIDQVLNQQKGMGARGASS